MLNIRLCAIHFPIGNNHNFKANSASELHKFSEILASLDSTMILIKGSVPDGLMRTLPSSPSLVSMLVTSDQN